MRSHGKYGAVAVRAAKMASEGVDPRDAWEAASSEVFAKGSPAQLKGCPRSAFLGLAGAGSIRGVPPGSYTRSALNVRYALEAADFLSRNPAFTGASVEVWERGVTRRPNVHNGQCDVVQALWSARCLAPQVSQ